MMMLELARRVIRDFRNYRTPIDAGPVNVEIVAGGRQISGPSVAIPPGYALVIAANDNEGRYAVQPAPGWRAFTLRIRYPHHENDSA